jgi:hypothetical protein
LSSQLPCLDATQRVSQRLKPSGVVHFAYIGIMA